MAIINFEYRDSDNVVSWDYSKSNIHFKKKKIENVKYYEKENLILILFEEDSPYSILVGMNEDGSVRFSFASSENKGVSYLTTHPDIKIAVVGWEKENNGWMDYYYSINPKNGNLNRHCRSY